MSTPESPTAPEPAIQRGARLLAEGDADAAVAVLRGLVAEAPVYAAAQVLLAASLDAAGRPDEGLEVWHQAAFLVPSSRLVQRKRLRLPEPAAPPTAEPPAPDTLRTPEPTGGPHIEEPAVAPERVAFEPPPPAADPAPAAEPTAPPEPAADAAAEVPTSTLPDEARVASPDELFSEIPAEIVAASQTVEPAPEPVVAAVPPPAEPSDVAPEASPAEPPAAAPRAQRPAAPDWGDLDDLSVSVLSPDTPDAPAPPESADPGGWAVVAERERSAPTRRGMAPPVVAPEPWAPPEERARVHIPGAPTASPTERAAPAEATVDAPLARPLDPAAAASAAPRAPDGTPASATSEPEPALADDLDALIQSLDTAPRITPDPEFDGPSPDRSGGDVDDLASETMARIYAAQHQYVEAAVMYERLAERSPDRAADLLARAAEMRDSASR